MGTHRKIRDHQTPASALRQIRHDVRQYADWIDHHGPCWEDDRKKHPDNDCAKCQLEDALNRARIQRTTRNDRLRK